MFSIRTNNYNVYFDNAIFAGTASVDLPNFTPSTSEISGSGIAGTLSIPARGHFGSMQLVLHWRNFDANAVRGLALGAHTVEVRAAVEAIDQATGAPKTIAQKFLFSVYATDVTTGSYAPNTESNASSTFEIIAMQVSENNKVLFELDKLNNICKTLNNSGELEDILEPVRAAM